MLPGFFPCGIAIYGLSLTTQWPRPPEHQGSFLERVPEFLRGKGAAVLPKQCQKGERGFVPAPAAMRWSPDNRTANGASWIFHSFLSFPFPPLDPSKDSVSIFANWRLGTGLQVWVLGWHGPAGRVLRNAPEKQSGPNDIGAISNRHVDTGWNAPSQGKCLLQPLGFIPAESTVSSDERRRSSPSWPCPDQQLAIGNCQFCPSSARVDSCQCGHVGGHRCSLKIARESVSTEWSIPASCKPVKDMHGWRAFHTTR